MTGTMFGSLERSPLRALTAASLLAALGAGCDDEAGGIGRVSGKIETAEVIDFGNVQLGIVSTRTIEVENVGTIGVVVTSIDAPSEDGLFEVEVGDDSFAIAPQGKHTLTVTFQPFQAMEVPVESDLVIHTDIPAGDAKVQLVVKVRGRGIESGLLVEPNPVDFGSVLIGSSRTMEARITNLLSEPVDVTTALEANGAAKIEPLGGSGRFELVSAIGPTGSIVGGGGLLQPDQSFVVELRYTPDPSAAGSNDYGRWVIRNCDNSLCEHHVRLNGKSTASGLECMPAVVQFGDINPGRIATRTVTCTNVSTGDLTVSGWGVSASTPAELTATAFPGTPLLVATGTTFNVEVHFAPTVATLGVTVTGALEVRSESEGRSLTPVSIPLEGTGGGPDIAILPDHLDFGRVAVGTSYSKRLLVENAGYSDLVVSMVTPDGSEAAMFAAAPGAFSLATGTSTIVTVTFSPTAEVQAVATLLFASNDGSDPVVGVPLSGIGVALPPCDYEIVPSSLNFGVIPVRQTATQSIRVQNNGATDCLMNDVEITGDPELTLANGPETNIVIPGGMAKDLPISYAPLAATSHSALVGFYISSASASQPTVPVFGVGLAQTEITCPAPVVTPAGSPVVLAMSAVTQGTTIVSYDWTITSAPPGGVGTPNQWAPDPPRAQTETFTPILVGLYIIHVTVVDSAGGTFSCDTQVTAEGHGLRVQLSWNGSGDVDLHLHNGAGGPSPWFSSPDDCYYANRTPTWNAARPTSTGENPELDIDNTFANGPENTRVDTVVVGQPYTIGVHNYSSAGGRTATVEIFCGGVTTPNIVYSQLLSGIDGGNCSFNDFWKVATVTFQSQNSCTITPINQTVPSLTACIAF